MIDIEGEPMPAPVRELARIAARREREENAALRRQERECEREMRRAAAKERRNYRTIDLGNGKKLTVTRERFEEIKRARRDLAKRERQKSRELGIPREGPPWLREDRGEKPKSSGKRVKKGFYTFD